MHSAVEVGREWTMRSLVFRRGEHRDASRALDAGESRLGRRYERVSRRRRRSRQGRDPGVFRGGGGARETETRKKKTNKRDKLEAISNLSHNPRQAIVICFFFFTQSACCVIF